MTREKVQNLLFGVNLESPHVKKVSFLFVSFFFILKFMNQNQRGDLKQKWDYLQKRTVNDM